FGLLALLLAGVGIHGVVAGEVAQRTREIGIRAALGAHPARIVREVVSRGLRLAWTGGAIGLVLCWWALPVLRKLPVGTDEIPLLPGIAAALILIAAAVVASYWPARRAAAIDPASTLRSE
ncbi:MAG: FtsX-like permease family protein, partial [Bryobacterales bacterium]|nr:FtsX-like permease family protein [Bryobacterales bacterium]